MKKLISFLLFFTSAQIYADFSEIKTPIEMVNCIERYIRKNMENNPAWEHAPQYVFLGKYFHASWHGLVNGYQGLFLDANKKSIVYCDYEIDENGIPLRGSKGFCNATVENAQIEFEHVRGDTTGRSINLIAIIVKSKIYCTNI